MRIEDRRKKNLRSSKGFTLAELMLTVAILMILASFAFVAVGNHQKRLRQLEANNVAKEIFNAAQNQLTSARANETWQVFLRSSSGYDENAVTVDVNTKKENLGKTTKGIDDPNILGVNFRPEGGYETHDYRYILVNSESDLDVAALTHILPKFSIDGTVRSSGSYIIEYDVTSASIFRVVYSNKSRGGRTLTEKDLDYDSSKGSDSEGKIVGSYGDGQEEAVIASARESSILKPLQAELVNGENLVLKITDPNYPIYEKYNHKNVPVYKVKVTNKDKDSDADFSGSFEISLSAAAGDFTPSNTKNAKYTGLWGNRTCTYDEKMVSVILLDSVTVQNGHFAQIFPTLDAGGDIDVEVSTSVTIDKEKQTIIAGDTDNSLFSRVSKDGTTAYLTRRRHMENLSTEIAAADKSSRNVFDKILTAYLNEDIDFNDLKDSYSTYYPLNTIYSAKGRKYASSTNFAGIVSNILRNFDGQDHTLSNLNMVGEQNDDISVSAKHAGLFNSLTAGSTSKDNPIRIHNLQLSHAKSSATKLHPGIIFGSVSGVHAYVDHIHFLDTPVVISVENSEGTIAGCVENAGSLDISDVTYDQGLIVAGSEDGTKDGGVNAGGLVGMLQNQSDATIRSVTINGNVKVTSQKGPAENNYNWFGAGGLIGTAYCATDKGGCVEISNAKIDAGKEGNIQISGFSAGGMIGTTHLTCEKLEMSDSSIYGKNISIKAYNRRAGGVIGWCGSAQNEIHNTHVKAGSELSVSVTGDAAHYVNAGGFIGCLSPYGDNLFGTEYKAVISECSVWGGKTGRVTVDDKFSSSGDGGVGGFIGFWIPYGNTNTITNCMSSISVEQTKAGLNSAGGFIGTVRADHSGDRAESSASITGCYSAGRTVFGGVYDTSASGWNSKREDSNHQGQNYQGAGGFLGSYFSGGGNNGSTLTVTSCYTTTSVYTKAAEQPAGGFAGTVLNNGPVSLRIEDSYSTGLVASGSAANTTVKSFIGKGELAAASRENSVLKGINAPEAYADLRKNLKIADGTGATSSQVSERERGEAPFLSANVAASPYDFDLPKSYSYYGVAQLGGGTSAATDKHIGDWPIPLSSLTDVIVDNGENLVLAINDPNEAEWTTDGTYQYIAKVTGASSEKSYTLRLTPQSGGTVKVEVKDPGAAANIYTAADYKGKWKALDNGNGYQVTALLDSITVQNAHFAQLFPQLTPGEDISVTVTPRLTAAEDIIRSGQTITAAIAEAGTKTTRTTVNSFFADGSTLTNALLTTRRHMENLSEEISTVSSIGSTSKYNITAANLKASLDFAAIQDRGADDYGYALAPLYLFNSSKGSYNADANFIGIVSNTLTKFDGEGNTLSNLNLVGEAGISNSEAKFTGYSRRSGLFTGLLSSGTIVIKDLVFDGENRSTNSRKHGVEAAILLTRVDKNKHVEVKNIKFNEAPQVSTKTDSTSTDSSSSAWEVHANAGVITACVAHNASLKITGIDLSAGFTVGDENDTAHNGYAAGGLAGLVIGSVEIGTKDTNVGGITIGGKVKVSGRDDELSQQSPNRNYYGAGAIMGSAYASGDSTNQSVKMYHVAVNADSVEIRSAYAGGMIGAVHFPFAEAEIEKCSMTAPKIKIADNNVSAGGFAGNLSAQSLKIIGCGVRATDYLQVKAEGANDHGAGGFIGEVMQRQEGDVQGTNALIENCFAAGGSAGSIKATNANGGINVGGFVGIFSPSSETSSIENCFASVPVSTTGGSAGAFAGDVLGDGEKVGGQHRLSAITIENCYASGRTHTGSYSVNDFNVVEGDKTNWYWSAAGGFIGVIRRQMTSLTISFCYTTASVLSNGDSSGAGGFIGAQNDGGIAPIVTNCYTTALVGGDNAQTFIGAGTLASDSGSNYVLAGINDASIETGATEDVVSVVEKGTAPFTVGNYGSAAPYDLSLTSIYDYYTAADLCESARIELSSDIEAQEIIKAHVGDWPVSSDLSTDNPVTPLVTGFGNENRALPAPS